MIDPEAYVEQADRRRPCVVGRVTPEGSHVVEVYELSDKPKLVEQVLFRGGEFTLWLNPGRYSIRSRGAGTLSQSTTVTLAPGARAEIALELRPRENP